MGSKIKLKKDKGNIIYDPKYLNNSSSEINVKELMRYLLNKWPWYLISIVLSLFIFGLYYMKTPYIYYQKSMILIKGQTDKQAIGGLERFNNLNKINLSNEIMQFQSQALMSKVIDRLQCNVEYKSQIKFREQLMYKTCPYEVVFLGFQSNDWAQFSMTAVDSISIKLNDIRGSFVADFESCDVTFDEKIILDYEHSIIIKKVQDLTSISNQEIRVKRNPVSAMCSYFLSNLAIVQEEYEASIISLAIRDISSIRAADVLNTLVDVYNEESILEKIRLAKSSAQFIDSRIIIIENELDSIENKIEKFKIENRLYDINNEVREYIGDSKRYEQQKEEIENKINTILLLKNYIIENIGKNDYLPANYGLNDMNIENIVDQFNSLKSKYDRYLKSGGDTNPVMAEIKTNLTSLQQSLLRSIDNILDDLEKEHTNKEDNQIDVDMKFTALPYMDRINGNMSRQQKLKESVYLFLLNKREENALSQAMVDNNAQIIDPAHGPLNPIAPVRNHMLALGASLGLIIPTFLFLILRFIDTSIHNGRDIEANSSIPFLGEIPYIKINRLKKNEKKFQIRKMLFDESIRVIRTNLKYQIDSNINLCSNNSIVISITSDKKNAGKTLVAKNLAISFSKLKRKVIVVDLNLRRDALYNKQLPSNLGISDYIANQSVGLVDIIQEGDDYDYISTGEECSKTSELAVDSRLDGLFKELRAKYDYILVDNVSIGFVADVSIINRLIDATIVVVRSNIINVPELRLLENMYLSNKLTNMMILLNGIPQNQYNVKI